MAIKELPIKGPIFTFRTGKLYERWLNENYITTNFI